METRIDVDGDRVTLPPGFLDGLMAARGVSDERLAIESGVAEATIRRARKGRPVAKRTIIRLDQALGRLPILAGPLGTLLRHPQAPAS